MQCAAMGFEMKGFCLRVIPLVDDDGTGDIRFWIHELTTADGMG